MLLFFIPRSIKTRCLLKVLLLRNKLFPAGPITHIRRGFAKGIFILGVLVLSGSSILGFAIACCISFSIM